MATDPTIHLLIRDREKVWMDEEVSSVSSVNDKGVFDVLPGHANFISIIHERVIIRQKGRADQEFPVGGGIMEVRSNNIEVYLGVSGGE
jgi:F0F1-type ATP synthase epsilon subunit